MCRSCFSPILLNSELHSSQGGQLFDAPPAQTSRRGFEATAVATAATFAADAGADVIFRGGTIIPLPGAAPVQGLAVGSGKILALGGESDVSPYKTNNTTIVDLDGRVMMPGFIDPHNHTVLSALILQLLEDVGYTKFPTRGKLIAELHAIVMRTPPGQWISCSNFDNLLQGGDLSREELDAVSTDHPIFVWYTNGHDACVNSAALKLANIPEDVGTLPGGGHFGRNETGALNGVVYEESAILKFVRLFLPKLTPQLAAKAISDYLKSAAASGNTMVHEPGTLRSAWIAPFSKLSTGMMCRTSASLMYEDMKGLDAYRNLGLGAKAAQIPDTLFTLYGVKIVGDGSNQTLTGAQTQAYLGSNDKGKPNFDAAQLKEMVRDVHAAELPVLIHCNGDYTIDIALDAIEAAYGASIDYGVNRIEHSTMVRLDQIQRMKKLNVQPSFLMNHVRFYGASYRDDIFGPERAANADPAGWCVREGLPFTLHTDSPCSPVGTLALVSTAVTRRCEVDGSVIGPDQAVTLDQALRSVTIDAARQIGMGDRIGSLAKGKEADLVILEDDPHKTDPNKLGSIKISETWVGGVKKYAS